MKIKSFLLVLLFSIIFKFHISYADEAKMKKGLEIFNETAGCAACHVLKAAGAEGNIGPNLDTVSNLTLESVKDIVTYGLGVMPAFGEGGILTKDEIDVVSFYVVNSIDK
jgi:cytochrome c6